MKGYPRMMGALLAAGMVAGCGTSSQMKRIDANRDVYETWPLEVRQAVLDGNAVPGMTPDMVRVALGEPTEVQTRSGPANSGTDEIWIYRTGGNEGTPPMIVGGAPGTMGGMGGIGGMGGGGVNIGLGGGRPTIGIGGPTIGIGTGGVGLGSSGIGMGTNGVGLGSGGIAGMPGSGGILVPGTPPTPAQEREVVFRNGVVYTADPPPEK